MEPNAIQPIRQSVTTDQIDNLLADVDRTNAVFNSTYPGDSTTRQPVHSVYVGAHQFKPGLVRDFGKHALAALDTYAPTPQSFCGALGLPYKDGADQAIAATIYERVRSKLGAQPIEDLRIDFEDGLGAVDAAEEDRLSVQAADLMAAEFAKGELPPFCGIRIKPFNELARRAIRTTDIFTTRLWRQTGGKLPPNFTLTMTKTSTVAQVRAFVKVLELIETANQMRPKSLLLEIMVELPQAVIGTAGNTAVRDLVAAAAGRCRGVPLGVYDYTAATNIMATYQAPDNPVCDFAKHVIQVSLAGSGVTISDGATNRLPIPPYTATNGAEPTKSQIQANTDYVHAAWRQHFDHIQHALRCGYYQGWDMHPAQLPVRYAACFNLYLSAREQMFARLTEFLYGGDRTAVRSVMDDPATMRAIVLFVLRGYHCGAFTRREVESLGVDLKTLGTLSASAILKACRRRQD